MPLEDIGALLLENRAITVSVALLDACVRHKIAVYICDEKHIPSGMMLGYQQHSRQSTVIEAQMKWSEPFKKRLWQSIVKQKIQNQKSVFEEIVGEKSPEFERYRCSVDSGDTLNREATVARLYFSKMLPDGCTRSTEHIYNHALNYGYAIIRGAMARSIVAYGFLSSVGIKHTNELNNYALVDDLIEPYRPYVDQFVFKNIPREDSVLEKSMRDQLVSLLTHPVELGGKTYTLMRAMEITAQSLVTATTEKDAMKLQLPEMI